MEERKRSTMHWECMDSGKCHMTGTGAPRSPGRSTVKRTWQGQGHYQHPLLCVTWLSTGQVLSICCSFWSRLPKGSSWSTHVIRGSPSFSNSETLSPWLHNPSIQYQLASQGQYSTFRESFLWLQALSPIVFNTHYSNNLPWWLKG